MLEPWKQPPARRRSARSRLIWPLLLLLVAVAVLSNLYRPARVFRLVADGPPPVVAPSGHLETVFEDARPASLRIEARNRNPLFGRTPIGIGSGFFITADGMLLTAYHVVDPTRLAGRSEPLYVGVSPSGKEYNLTLVGFDAFLDLAVLQADTEKRVPFIPLASSIPRPGNQVVAIGNSRGDFLKGRAGRITRLGVKAGRADFADDTIEMTAALAPGDSGGPVLNSKGEAIGVVSYISFSPGTMTSESEQYVPPFLRGIALPQEFASYAVPVAGDSQVVSALLAGERRDVPVIGFSWTGFDYHPGDANGVYLGPRPGPVVARVQPGSPAEEAGLRSLREQPVYNEGGSIVGRTVEADVIVAVDGVPTPGFNDLLSVIRHKAIGQTVVLTVQRGRATIQLKLTLGAKRQVFE